MPYDQTTNMLQGQGARGGSMNPQSFALPYDTGHSRMLQTSTQTPQGMQLLNMLMSRGSQGMQNMPAPQFGPIKQAYEQNYRQNVMPSIAERFAGLGGEGAAGSSGFKASMLGAENQLQTQLAGMEQGFNQQNLAQLMQMLGMGLQPQFENMYMPREKSTWENLLSSLAGGTGTALGMTADQWGPGLMSGLAKIPSWFRGA